MDDFVIWKNTPTPGACRLCDFTASQHLGELGTGQPLGARFDPAASMSMNPDFPTDTRLTDALLNTISAIIVSERLAAHLRLLALPHVEYLPLGVRDHAGRLIDATTFIVHPTEPIDCLDPEASQATLRRRNVSGVRRLAIHADRIPSDRRLVRIERYFRVILVRRSLVEALMRDGFTGVGYKELQDQNDFA